MGPINRKYNILGLSSGYISIISDTLFKIHGKDITIQIVKNVTAEDDTPFKLKSLEYKEIMHNKWKDHSGKILMGVIKVKTKKVVYQFFKNTYSIDFKKYSNIVHPKTDIAETLSLKNGIFCSAGVVISPFTSIGNLVTINRNVSIGHHTNISDFCTLNPGSNIAGFCNIGKDVTIGMGANIIEGVKIGHNTIIGAGSLVTRDLPENVVAYGVPARIIRENTILEKIR